MRQGWDQSTSPMILYSKVLHLGCGMQKFGGGKHEGLLVVFQECGVVGLLFLSDTQQNRDFLKEILQGQQVSASYGESNVFNFHCALCNDRLKSTFPHHGTISNHDDDAGSRTNIVWILIIFCAPHASKIYINVTINSEFLILKRFQDHFLVSS
eukprot:8374677-Ditylum_brightwellii.AAC.2